MTLSSTDYAQLAERAYLEPELGKRFELGGVGYKAIDYVDQPSTGLQAVAYRRLDTNELVIAYRGTEFGREPVHDGVVDAGMVLLGVNAQAPGAMAFTKKVIESEREDASLNHREVNITVTGHSLGGTLAEINAAKFGLKGETFNAYGAGSLFGVPSGGNQVIDHVRAGDVVSAASPHFGEVRVYAAQQDIDTLSKAGYHDDSGRLSLRNPVKAIDFQAHAIDNFVPQSKLLGHSIISDESQARYRAHEGMIDRYRGDVMGVRKGLSAPWEVPKTVVGEARELGHTVAEKVREGAHVVEHAAEKVGHEVKDAYHHVKDDVSRGVHAVEDTARSAWNTVSHPGSWFEHDKPTVPLDHASHPDHALFTQARAAVHQVDREHSRTPDVVSDNVAGSLVVKARQEGLTRIDRAVLSDDMTRMYGVQGSMESPLKRVVEVPTVQAAQTSIADSSVAWQQVARQQQQVTPQPPVATQQTTQESPRPHGP